MIRHIVMWKFREGTEREQEQFLTGLRGLFGVIPQLRRCEVKRCVGKDNYDAVLVSEFASMEDLQTYKDDPRHKAVSALCKSIRTDRVAADYNFHTALIRSSERGARLWQDCAARRRCFSRYFSARRCSFSPT